MKEQSPLVVSSAKQITSTEQFGLPAIGKGLTIPKSHKRSQTSQGVSAHGKSRYSLRLPSRQPMVAACETLHSRAHALHFQDRLRPPPNGLLRVASPYTPRRRLYDYPHGMGASHRPKDTPGRQSAETSRIEAIEACTLCPLQPLHRSSEVGLATREEDAPRSTPSASLSYRCIQRGAANEQGFAE